MEHTERAIPLVIHTIGGYCPCQAEGAFYGNPFYFRARHGRWTIEVARPGSDPINNPELFYLGGQDPTNGYMQLHTAVKEIGRAFEAFVIRYADQISRGADWPDPLPFP